MTPKMTNAPSIAKIDRMSTTNNRQSDKISGGKIKLDRRSFLLRQKQKHERKHHEVELRDGRTMCYVVDGPSALEEDPTLIKDSELPVIFAFHGMYLSAESLILTDSYRKQTTKESFNYVIIGVNRAGYHGSSNVTLGEYSYTEFALDVGEIADALEIPRFGLVGHSSGGPNVLACASILGSNRVTGFCTLGSDPEYSRFDDIPYSIELDCCIGNLLPRFLGMFLPCTKVANGMRNDYILERRDYPFDSESIEQRGVVIAAEDDRFVPGWLSKRVKDRLKNAYYAVVPKVEHCELLKDEILDTVYCTVVQLMSQASREESNTTTEQQQENWSSSSWQNLAINQLIRERTMVSESNSTLSMVESQTS